MLKYPERMEDFRREIETFAGYLRTLKTTSSVRDMDMDIVRDFFADIAEGFNRSRDFGHDVAEAWKFNYLNLESEIGPHITTDPVALAVMFDFAFTAVERLVGEISRSR